MDRPGDGAGGYWWRRRKVKKEVEKKEKGEGEKSNNPNLKDWDIFGALWRYHTFFQPSETTKEQQQI